MYWNAQRSFNEGTEYYVEPSTPSGGYRASVQKKNDNDLFGDFSPSLLDLHLFDIELLRPEEYPTKVESFFLTSNFLVIIPSSLPRWMPLMVARLWHRSWLDVTLKTPPAEPLQVLPSPYLSLPLMSIVRIIENVDGGRMN